MTNRLQTGSGPVIVVMYHALYGSSSERSAIDAEDRPYAVSLDLFRQHLDCIAELRLPVVDPGTRPRSGAAVMLSFDDGHLSNYDLAFPLLMERNWPGLFFVTTDFIERRAGFCGWDQLREMAKAGMHIGSHCKTHRFLDDLPEEDARLEFDGSRAAILAGTGSAPRWLSFPGGRYRRAQLAMGCEAGYELFFSSEVGVNTEAAFRRGSVLNRVAIRESLSLPAFRELVSGAPGVYARARLMSQAKRGVQRLIGNRAYHALYARLRRE